MKNCAPLKALSLNKIFRQSLLPKVCGPGVSLNFWNFGEIAFKYPKNLIKILIRWLKKQSPLKGFKLTYHDLVRLATCEELQKFEVPSATFHASARSLARLAAMMANQGEQLEENDEKNKESKPLMKKSTWNTMHSKTTRAFDAAHYGKNIFIFLNRHSNRPSIKNINFFQNGGQIFLKVVSIYIQWKIIIQPMVKIIFAEIAKDL